MSKFRVRVLLLSVVLSSFFTVEMSSQLPDTTCLDAGVFCDPGSMYSQANGDPWSLPDGSDSGSNFNLCEDANGANGQPQNILFFAFVASSNTVRINIEIVTIQKYDMSSKLGYQYGIVDMCFDENNKNAEITYLDCDAVQGIVNDRIVESDQFIPGHTYYLYIDGFEASKVSFNLDVLVGIGGFEVDTVDSFNVSEYGIFKPGDTISVCQDGSFTIEALGVSNAASYLWYNQDVLDTSDSSSLTYRFDSDTTIYKICSQSYTDCSVSDTSCIYVAVDTIATEYLDTAYICQTALTKGVDLSEYDWLCGTINQAGTYMCPVRDSVGCHYMQQIVVIAEEEPINTVDTVICNSDIVYNDTTIRNTYKTVYDCDSIVDKNFHYFYYEGEISDLECSNNGSFELKIISFQYNSADYTRVQVGWYDENDILLRPVTSSFDSYLVTKPGRYYAVITLYKGAHYSCSFDLEEVLITDFPSALFSVNNDTICSTDSILLNIDNYIDTLDYKVIVDNGTFTDLSEGKFILKYNTSGEFDVKIVVDYKDCSFEVIKNIVVQPEISEPNVHCVEQTNSSVTFEWTDSDCVDEFEVWIDGKFEEIVSVNKYTVNNLGYGENVDIKIVTISDCVCLDKSDSTFCTALPCPDRQVSIVDVPDQICFNTLLDTSYALYEADTIGIPKWVGDIIDESGKIVKNMVSAGDYMISLEYEVNGCMYFDTTTISIFPELKVDFIVNDISCFDTEDGTIEVFPTQGVADFILNMNGQNQDSLFVGYLSAGDYHFLVTDANGCAFEEDFSIFQPEEPIIEVVGDVKVKFNQEYKYFLEHDGVDPDSVFWYKDDTLICTNFCDTISIVPNNDFTLCALMFFDSTCIIEDCLDVIIDRNFDIYVPNIFTPDFDNINDNFTISSTNGLSMKIKTFQIFNRWGENLYMNNDFIIKSENSFSGWNGLFKGQKVPSGVYIYYIEVETDDGEINKLYGDVTLYR